MSGYAPVVYGNRRSRSGARGASSISGGQPYQEQHQHQQAPPGMGSERTHRRAAQRSRSRARDAADAPAWRHHVAALPASLLRPM